MSKKNETVADIVAELRRGAELYSLTPKYTHVVSDKQEAMHCTCLADRIEAAWKRERAEVEASALSVGGFVEASRRKDNKPARNCDRYGTLAEALLASGEMSADAPGINGMGGAQLVRFVRWLFAPAAGEINAREKGGKA